MSAQHTRNLIYHLRRLFVRTVCDERTDRELLDVFVTTHDESAFHVLLQRHATLVMGVCPRAHDQPEDSDDAMQAPFLALVQQASSYLWRSSVPRWPGNRSQFLAFSHFIS